MNNIFKNSMNDYDRINKCCYLLTCGETTVGFNPLFCRTHLLFCCVGAVLRGSATHVKESVPVVGPR